MIRISLEQVAAKIQWLKSQGHAGCDQLLRTPRYIEALCFLQAASYQPGGLEAWCERLVETSPDWIRTLPEHWDNFATQLYGSFRGGSFAENVRNWVVDQWHSLQTSDVIYDPDYRAFGYYLPGFLEQVAKFMDAHALAEMGSTADTSLRRTVFSELDFARESSIPMVLVADTRHGKTTAVETYCRAYPGRARLIVIPESNHERELYAAYADAFGIVYTPKMTARWLKDRVQFTLRNTGLFCIHDEAHWLVPIRYHRDTPPQRLNWVRTQLIDRHLPCAFFCTPQSQEETLARYVDRTHHNMEQWLGRMPKPVLISENPTYEDLMSVARNRFPEFSDAVLRELCDAADEKIEGAGARLNGEGGFKIVELAGARARHLSKGHGGRVTVEDVRRGLTWAGAPLPTENLPATARSTPGRRGAVAAVPPARVPGELLAARKESVSVIA